jgi:hypothetical protein
MKRRVPWYVYACVALAFLGGWFTVLLCAIVALIYIPLATFHLFNTKDRTGNP